MNILVTGGAGYIGCELVCQLNRLNKVKKIIVYDNLSRGQYNLFYGDNNLDKVDFVSGNILDSDKLLNNLKDMDMVIHLAAFVTEPFNHLQNLQYEQVNAWGTLNVVRAIQKSPSVKSAFYMSSTAVYGFNNNIDSKINKPIPENGYGVSKLNGEEYFTLLKKTHTTRIMQSANVFGFNNFLGIDGVLNTFMFDAIVSNEIKIYGDGKQSRPFVFIENLIKDILDWVNTPANTDVLEIDFNATMNELKDWINDKIENLSYRYINQNQKFPSQSFLIADNPSYKQDQLEKAWESFNNSIRIKKAK